MLKIERRQAHLAQIKFCGEFHGEAAVTAADITLNGITLDAETLDALLPGTAEYIKAHDGLPWNERLGVQKFAEGIEGAIVRFYIGLDDAATTDSFAPATLGSIKLEAANGGAVMSLNVRARPDLTEWLLKLLDRVGRKVDVEIQADHYGSQGSLELTGGSDDAADGDAGEPPLDPEAERAASQIAQAAEAMEAEDARRNELLDKAEVVELDDDEKAELKALIAKRQPNAEPVL